MFASVLGGIINSKQVSSGEDLDNIVDPGFYGVDGNNNVGNVPVAEQGCLIVVQGLSKRRSQLFMTIGTTKMYHRTRSNSTSWSVWVRIYDTSILTDSSALTPLASALGGMPSMYINVTDADAAITPGFYQHSNWVSNTPASAGILIMPYYYTGYWKFQLFCDNQSNHMWFRSGSSLGYSPWKQIV